MKSITFKLAFLIAIMFTSCNSDELTKSKAESIIEDCQEKTGKKMKKTNIYHFGSVRIPNSDSPEFSTYLDKHKKMEDLGLVNISEQKKDPSRYGSGDPIVEVTLTPKGKEYLVGRIDDMFGRKKAQFISCYYKVKEINEIQIIPERNEAKVKITLERYDETPFFEKANEKKNPQELKDTATFRKTTDGWKACD